MTIWYILLSFGTFIPVSVSCAKKNLATLRRSVVDHRVGFSFPFSSPDPALAAFLVADTFIAFVIFYRLRSSKPLQRLQNDFQPHLIFLSFAPLALFYF
jgi:hypothetical protein